MTILVFGSLNIDHVYRVDHIVAPGETIPSTSYECFQGGKGANQSIALARAGAPVAHAGRIGQDGVWLRDQLALEGIEVAYVEVGEEPTGHALIQVDRGGENAIVLYGGANQAVDEAEIRRVLTHFGSGDWVLLQNEISGIEQILLEAKRRGLSVAFNPAPMTDAVADLPLAGVSLFVVNETEGAALTGQSDVPAILEEMRRRYPRAAIVLTAGAAGAHFADVDRRFHTPAMQVDVVDTTAAGDTFIGYLLADLFAGETPEAAMATATAAAAIAVTRAGAAPSIPFRREVAT